MAGRPKGATAPKGTQRTQGKAVRMSANEWAALCEPYREPGESNSDLVVRLLRERLGP